MPPAHVPVDSPTPQQRSGAIGGAFIRFGIGAKLGLAGAALALLAVTATGIGIYGQFA